MARSEETTTAAAKMLRDFFNRHLPLGTGNGGKSQSASIFASRSGISPGRVSEWRNCKGGLPRLDSLETIERIFFPHSNGRTNSPAYLEWQDVRRAITNHEIPNNADPDTKRYSMRNTWDLMTKSLTQNTIPIVRSSSHEPGAGALSRKRICARPTDKAFILPMPDWFMDAIRREPSFRDSYDMHTPVSFSGEQDFTEFFGVFPVLDFQEMVAYHVEAHARAVIEALRRRPAYPPFNKKKLGLLSYQQPQRSGEDEGLYLDLHFFETDYHTHRVMKRVLYDLRASHPHLLVDDADPYGAMPFLPYLTTSFGVNIVVTTQEAREKRFYMTRLSNRQGNINQQGLWHVSANEGLSLEDLREGQIDMGDVVERALMEELGATYVEPIDETLYLEFAIDRRNYEPFLSCVVHLSKSKEEFHRHKQHLARDDRREFQEVRDYPFTEQAIIQLLLDSPSGAAEFTSYCLNILDSLIVRELAPRVGR